MDNIIVKEIDAAIRTMEQNNQNKLLLISDITNRSQINLSILKYFLQDKREKGAFITFDRPHQYMSKLLTYNSINQKNLIFIDAVSMISGETSADNGRNVQFVNGPFQIEIFKNLVGRGFGPDGTSKPTIDLSNLGFVMIDDISALSLYNDSESIECFIRTFFSMVDSLNNFIVSLVIDINYHKDIYKILYRFCDRQIVLDPSSHYVDKLDKEESILINRKPEIASRPEFSSRINSVKGANGVIV